MQILYHLTWTPFCCFSFKLQLAIKSILSFNHSNNTTATVAQ